MKRFIRNIIQILVLALLVLAVADFAYTKVLVNSAPTDKIALLKSLKGKKFNYVFLGSSRVNNTIIPAEIEKQTGKTSVNFGVNSSRPRDILAFAKLLVDNNITCDSIFVQVDYGFNHLDGSSFVNFESMPYLHQEPILAQRISDLPQAKAFQFVPFFRYAFYDQQFGCRKVIKKLMEKSPSSLELSGGYTMLKGHGKLGNYELPKTVAQRNRYVDELEKLASEHKLNIVYFISPFAHSVRNKDFFGKLKTRIPKLHDYSQAIATDSFFSNESHLNHDGAKVFTNLVIRDLIGKRKDKDR
ncbi:hypothetical protein [Flavobacterium sp.]|uniref:hypothetical protein n=1 Tax=Flavobacterium sp. TaxID=239 RepID=UPI0011F98976|nr:hypothetical protein [Flavobacterium sp.]RZJ69978.1 MAG: hypothetical protein EOO49_15090 [Flavobacterium sp.]